jgi:hypothetical protein
MARKRGPRAAPKALASAESEYKPPRGALQAVAAMLRPGETLADLRVRHEAERLEFEKHRAKLETEIAAAERRLAQLRAAPKLRMIWPGESALRAMERLITPGNVRAAIGLGWIVREPNDITKRALKVMAHETLWRALHLDADVAADAFLAALKRLRRRWDTDERVLRARSELVDRAIEPRLKLALARVHKDEHLLERSGEVLAYLEAALDHFQLSVDAAELERRRLDVDIACFERLRQPNFAARWRGTVLGWLLDVLDGWSTRDLADLILASSADFANPPCPEFVAHYCDDPGRLAKAITKMIARESKRASKRAV